MAQINDNISDDTIIRLQAMQLIAMRNEAPSLRDHFGMAALTGLLMSNPNDIYLFRKMWEAADAAMVSREASMEARNPKPSGDKAVSE